MGLLSTLKSVLGMDDSSERGDPGVSVSVERERDVEPDAAGERAVEEPDVADGPARDADLDRAADDVGTGGGDTAASASEDDGDAEEAAIAADDAGESVDAIKGIGQAYAERLAGAGVETVGDLAGADATDLAGETDLSASRLEEWIERARDRTT